MNTVSKLFTKTKSSSLEVVLNDLIHAMNHRKQSVLASYKVGEMEVEIIRYLIDHEQKKMKEVGEYFKIKLSTLTSTIDKLEKAKLVKRKNSKEDRRVIFIRPTPKGQTLLDDLEKATSSVTGKLVDESSSKESDILVQGLHKLLAYASETS